MLGYNNTKYFVYSLIYKIVCHLYFTRKEKYYSKLTVFWGRKTKIQTTLKVMHNMLKPETKLNEFDYTYIHDLNRIVQRPSSNSSTFITESTCVVVPWHSVLHYIFVALDISISKLQHEWLCWVLQIWRSYVMRGGGGQTLLKLVIEIFGV